LRELSTGAVALDTGDEALAFSRTSGVAVVDLELIELDEIDGPGTSSNFAEPRDLPGFKVGMAVTQLA
jgi:hypothetical protein